MLLHLAFVQEVGFCFEPFYLSFLHELPETFFLTWHTGVTHAVGTEVHITAHVREWMCGKAAAWFKFSATKRKVRRLEIIYVAVQNEDQNPWAFAQCNAGSNYIIFSRIWLIYYYPYFGLKTLKSTVSKVTTEFIIIFFKQFDRISWHVVSISF